MSAGAATLAPARRGGQGGTNTQAAPVAPTAAPAARRPVNPWVIALTVTLATFMEVLDTSIANVALPHISGNLGAARSQSTWVLTSYLVANAIVLPLSAWFIGLLGRKRFYMICVFLFTVSSALCGAAPNLELLIFFRILQGIGGGGLAPTEQGILVDTFPKEKFGMAMAMYGVAIIVAPILGPTLGGWITDNYSWRWIFYINVPIGIASLFLTNLLIHDPPGMAEQVRENRKRGFRVDFVGLSLMSIGLGSLEFIYAKGQELDWFGSRLIVGFIIAAVVSLTLLVVWELVHPDPIINLRLFGERNFLTCSIMMYLIFGVLYGSNANLPTMLQELFGYDAINAGLILSPGAVCTMITMPIVGFLLGKKVDSRYLIPVGLTIMAVSCYWQAHLNFNTSPFLFVAVRSVTMFGLGFLFVPVNNAAYLYISRSQTNNATGLFNLIRNEGGSMGIALATTMVDRRAQFHQSRLAEHVRLSSPEVQLMLRGLGSRVTEAVGVAHSSAASTGYGLLYRMVVRQARLMAYLDVYWIFWIMTLATFPLLFFMKRSVAEGNAMSAH